PWASSPIIPSPGSNSPSTSTSRQTRSAHSPWIKLLVQPSEASGIPEESLTLCHSVADGTSSNEVGSTSSLFLPFCHPVLDEISSASYRTCPKLLHCYSVINHSATSDPTSPCPLRLLRVSVVKKKPLLNLATPLCSL